jgi:hypothetical protein
MLYKLKLNLMVLFLGIFMCGCVASYQIVNDPIPVPEAPPA